MMRIRPSIKGRPVGPTGTDHRLIGQHHALIGQRLAHHRQNIAIAFAHRSGYGIVQHFIVIDRVLNVSI